MSADQITLGITFGCPHGTAGVVARDGRIVSAIQLERLLGIKYAWVANLDHVFGRGLGCSGFRDTHVSVSSRR